MKRELQGTVRNQANRFGELLRSGLWRCAPNQAVFTDGQTDWKLMYAWARSQTLVAIVLDGVNRLPKSLRPERELYLKWTHLAMRVEMANRELDLRVADLGRMFEEAGQRFVLVKGQGIAREYPVPSHRQCGDIDIYTGGSGYQIVNRLLASDGGVSDKDLGRFEKHRGFVWRNVRVENHRLLVRFGTPWIRSRAKKWEVEGMQTSRQVSINGVKVYVPEPFFNAQYLLIHAVLHLLSGGIGLRQLCDWAVLLRNHAVEFDRDEWMAQIRDLGLEHSYKVFGCLAVDYLGLPPAFLPMDCSRFKREADKLLRDILQGGNFGSIRLRERRRETVVWKRKIQSFFWMSRRLLKAHRFYPVEAEFRFLDSVGVGIGRILGLHKF